MPEPRAPHTNGTAAILLLTATIEPSARMPNNLRADPALRRRDYEEALAAYLAMPGLDVARILFVENSGADLGSLERVVQQHNPFGRQVEFFSYISDAPPERGKSYAEMEILDRAHAHLSAIEPPDRKIWKLTGRLIVQNLAALMARAPAEFAIYGDFRDVPYIGESLGGNQWLDTRLIAYSLAGYGQWLLGQKEKSEEFPCIERQFFGLLRPHTGAAATGDAAAIVPRFSTTPKFAGICGGSDADYENMTYRIKYAIRETARRIAPGVWL